MNLYYIVAIKKSRLKKNKRMQNISNENYVNKIP